MSIAVKPSSAALRISSSSTPGFLCSMSSMAGRISCRPNRAAVAAIWRCSSLRSSGVKTSAGKRDSSRKLPPAAGTMEEVVAGAAADELAGAAEDGEDGEAAVVDMSGSLAPKPKYFNKVDAGKRRGVECRPAPGKIWYTPGHGTVKVEKG